MSKSRLTIAVSPFFAGLLAVFYRPHTDTAAALSETKSVSIAQLDTLTPTAGTKSAKRKRSDMDDTSGSEHAPPLTPLVVVRPLYADAPKSDIPCLPVPPSPVPTEIDEERLHVPQDEATAAAQAAGVKVRDFAYESWPPTLRAPELWRSPLHTLLVHDRYVRAGPSWRNLLRLPGKLLWRLTDAGLVTPEEAQRNWDDQDRAACAAYASRPEGPHPYIMQPVRKPTAEHRRRICLKTYPPVPVDDVPEDQIYMPPDTDDMDDGTSEVSSVYPGGVNYNPMEPPTSVSGENADAEESSEISSAVAEESPRTKRRRLMGHETTSSAESPSSLGASEPSKASQSTHPGASTDGSAQQGPCSAPVTSETQKPPSGNPAPGRTLPKPRPLRRRNVTRQESIIW